MGLSIVSEVDSFSVSLHSDFTGGDVTEHPAYVHFLSLYRKLLRTTFAGRFGLTRSRTQIALLEACHQGLFTAGNNHLVLGNQLLYGPQTISEGDNIVAYDVSSKLSGKELETYLMRIVEKYQKSERLPGIHSILTWLYNKKELDINTSQAGEINQLLLRIEEHYNQYVAGDDVKNKFVYYFRKLGTILYPGKMNERVQEPTSGMKFDKWMKYEIHLHVEKKSRKGLKWLIFTTIVLSGLYLLSEQYATNDKEMYDPYGQDNELDVYPLPTDNYFPAKEFFGETINRDSFVQKIPLMLEAAIYQENLTARKDQLISRQDLQEGIEKLLERAEFFEGSEDEVSFSSMMTLADLVAFTLDTMQDVTLRNKLALLETRNIEEAFGFWFNYRSEQINSGISSDMLQICRQADGNVITANALNVDRNFVSVRTPIDFILLGKLTQGSLCDGLYLIDSLGVDGLSVDYGSFNRKVFLDKGYVLNAPTPYVEMTLLHELFHPTIAHTPDVNVREGVTQFRTYTGYYYVTGKDYFPFIEKRDDKLRVYDRFVLNALFLDYLDVYFLGIGRDYTSDAMNFSPGFDQEFFPDFGSTGDISGGGIDRRKDYPNNKVHPLYFASLVVADILYVSVDDTGKPSGEITLDELKNELLNHTEGGKKWNEYSDYMTGNELASYSGTPHMYQAIDVYIEAAYNDLVAKGFPKDKLIEYLFASYFLEEFVPDVRLPVSSPYDDSSIHLGKHKFEQASEGKISWSDFLMPGWYSLGFIVLYIVILLLVIHEGRKNGLNSPYNILSTKKYDHMIRPLICIVGTYIVSLIDSSNLSEHDIGIYINTLEEKLLALEGMGNKLHQLVTYAGVKILELVSDDFVRDIVLLRVVLFPALFFGRKTNHYAEIVREKIKQVLTGTISEKEIKYGMIDRGRKLLLQKSGDNVGERNLYVFFLASSLLKNRSMSPKKAKKIDQFAVQQHEHCLTKKLSGYEETVFQETCFGMPDKGYSDLSYERGVISREYYDTSLGKVDVRSMARKPDFNEVVFKPYIHGPELAKKRKPMHLIVDLSLGSDSDSQEGSECGSYREDDLKILYKLCMFAKKHRDIHFSIVLSGYGTGEIYGSVDLYAVDQRQRNDILYSLQHLSAQVYTCWPESMQKAVKEVLKPTKIKAGLDSYETVEQYVMKKTSEMPVLLVSKNVGKSSGRVRSKLGTMTRYVNLSDLGQKLYAGRK